MPNKKISVVVGGKLQIRSLMQMVNILRVAGIKTKAIDPLGCDIKEIIENTSELDYLLLDRNSSIGTRLRLIRNIRKLKCNLVLYRLGTDVTKTTFYDFYCKNEALKEDFNDVLQDYFNTSLRQPCSPKNSKFKYKLYLLQQSFLDLRRRWAKRYYLSYY